MQSITYFASSGVGWFGLRFHLLGSSGFINWQGLQFRMTLRIVDGIGLLRISASFPGTAIFIHFNKLESIFYIQERIKPMNSSMLDFIVSIG